MPIELSGMDELLARLASTTQNVERTKEKALKKGAEVIKEEMSTNAPVLTGNLKENIEVSDMKTKNSSEYVCLLYTSPSPRDRQRSRMPSSA